MGLNTVVTPLSWELIEPERGQFDFALVDGLLEQARNEHQRIVFLWLATWKNGMSSYAPVWVKQDTRRFPRVMENGSRGRDSDAARHDHGEPMDALLPRSCGTSKKSTAANTPW